MKPEIEIIIKRRSLVGEGTIWDYEKSVLYWVDILDQKVFIYDPAKETNKTIDTLQAVGTVVPRASGGLMVALHNGFASLDIQTGVMQPFGDPERKIPANRFNDGKCDPAGRFWAGTMEFNGATGCGSLYCLETDGTITKKLDDISISNGIVWSHDHQTMYFIDTARNNVRAFAYDLTTGAISNDRITVTNQDSGFFDGMTIDEEGMLWIAIFGGAAVRRYHPETGRLLATIELPTKYITSCAFGGPNLDELYITSATHQMSEAELNADPLGGTLFRVKSATKGIKSLAYKG